MSKLSYLSLRTWAWRFRLQAVRLVRAARMNRCTAAAPARTPASSLGSPRLGASVAMWRTVCAPSPPAGALFTICSANLRSESGGGCSWQQRLSRSGPGACVSVGCLNDRRSNVGSVRRAPFPEAPRHRRLAVRRGDGGGRGVCAVALPPVHELLRQIGAVPGGAGVRRTRLALEAGAP